MKTLTNHQTILDSAGEPAFVVIPYGDFIKMSGIARKDLIPNEVVGKHVMEEISMLQAWREYLGLTQDELAKRMGMTQAGYAQIESAKKPRKVTLKKAAAALGVAVEQLGY